MEMKVFRIDITSHIARIIILCVHFLPHAGIRERGSCLSNNFCNDIHDMRVS